MRYGVVVFPGSNCDRDALHAIGDILGEHTVTLWHKEDDLKGVDVVILPGGFSYGDYLRAGALARFSPIMKSIMDFTQHGGRVLGICNGFQILCEAGLLPGALRPNHSRRFICKNIHVLPEVKNTLPTAGLHSNQTLKVPIAHGEGAYYADNTTLAQMRKDEQILFRYSNPDGTVRDSVNPNGSVDNIAGICDKNRRIIGMMPHPERACDVAQGNTDGLQILRSIFQFWERN